MVKNKFDSVLIFGMGLIGSSIARAIKKNNLATKAIKIMEKYEISSLIVSEDEKIIDGIIHLQDLLKNGIV